MAMSFLGPERFGISRADTAFHSCAQNNSREDGDYAQPLALKRNDRLANGWLLSHGTLNTVDGVSILFRNDKKRYVPSRLPIKLFQAGVHGVLPQDLRVGDVLQTGDVVLAEPEEVETDKPYGDTEDQFNTRIYLSGGQRLQATSTPNDLHLARFGTLDDLSPDAALTRMTMNKLKYLRQSLLVKALKDFAIIDTIHS